MNFIKFRDAVNEQLALMVTTSDSGLLTTHALGREVVEVYLKAFPEGSNPIHKERTEHECNCCFQFIRQVGNIVAYIDNNLVSIWDVVLQNEPEYSVVAKAMSDFVKAHPINTLFYTEERKAGTKRNFDMDAVAYDHFYWDIPAIYRDTRDTGKRKGEARDNKKGLQRSLEELSKGSIEIVLELIEDNSLYRGQEQKLRLTQFLELSKKYDEALDKEAFLWKHSVDLGVYSNLRSSVIGTLLEDISSGKSLESAVASYEAKVAPQNYRRSSAPVTQSMIDKAEARIEELGLTSALQRRYAEEQDISVEDVLFINTDVATKVQGALSMLKPTKSNIVVTDDSKVNKVTKENFLSSILPKADKIEVMVTDINPNNLMSLVAPADATAKPLLQWDNNFSWTYRGGVTDSIKTNVAKAGGNVEGDFRVSLSWDTKDDLDLALSNLRGYGVIAFHRRNGIEGGSLDVDANYEVHMKEPVENIVFPKASSVEGKSFYVEVVNNGRRVGTDRFTIQVEYMGNIVNYEYSNPLSGKVKCLEIDFDNSGNMTVTKYANPLISEGTGSVGRSEWGITSGEWAEVSLVTKSPNQWDTNKIKAGQEHVFFFLKDCANPDESRGLYTEFLHKDLRNDRKVFELLGSALKVPKSTEQLSGIGFTEGRNDSVTLKVIGTNVGGLYEINF